jgi:hypothetical protein
MIGGNTNRYVNLFLSLGLSNRAFDSPTAFQGKWHHISTKTPETDIVGSEPLTSMS